jgi:hypothetical protein
MPIFFTFIFLSYDTVQNMIVSHHTILYDEAGIFYEMNWWSILSTSQTVAVMRLGQAGFMGGF